MTEAMQKEVEKKIQEREKQKEEKEKLRKLVCLLIGRFVLRLIRNLTNSMPIERRLWKMFKSTTKKDFNWQRKGMMML